MSGDPSSFREHFNHGWGDKRYLVKATNHCKRAYRRYERSMKKNPSRIDASKERDDFQNGNFQGRNHKTISGGKQIRTLSDSVARRYQVDTRHAVEGVNDNGRWIFCIGPGTDFDPNADPNEPENLVLIDFVGRKTDAFDPARADLNGVPETLWEQEDEPDGEEIITRHYESDDGGSTPPPPTPLTGKDLEAVIHWMDSTMDIQPTEEQVVAIRNPAPLFINGQAGSGKTVMLAFRAGYEFAESVAKDTADNILISAMSPHVTEILETSIVDYVREFHENQYTDLKAELKDGPRGKASRIRILDVQNLFLEAIPLDARKPFLARGSSEINTSNLIGFGRFRNWFHRMKQSSPDITIGAELAWFGIRSIILGNSHLYESKYVPPSEFTNHQGADLFGANDAEVLYKVFQKYRQWKEDRGYFDELDIALAAHQNKEHIEQRYTRLFLDEAQDLTLLELDMLMAHLKADRRKQLILAGDPLQTINPTGFDWDTLKALMWRTFGGLQVDDPYNLTTNFRSAKQIVDVGNDILDLQTFYAKKTTVSQNHVRSGRDVVFLPIESIDKDQLNDVLTNTRVVTDRMQLALVPDETTLQQALNEVGGTEISSLNDHRFETIVQAKGRQAGSVLLLCPSRQIENALRPLLVEKSKERQQGLTDAQQLGLKFLLNQLYVAVTRAKSHLVIIDSQNAIDTLFTPMLGSKIRVVNAENDVKYEVNLLLKAGSNERPLETAQSLEKDYKSSGKEEKYLTWIIDVLTDVEGVEEERMLVEYQAEREIRRAERPDLKRVDKDAYLKKAAAMYRKIAFYARAYGLLKDIEDWPAAWELISEQPHLVRDNDDERMLLGFLVNDGETIRKFWEQIIQNDAEKVIAKYRELPLAKNAKIVFERAIERLIDGMQTGDEAFYAITHLVNATLTVESRKKMLDAVARSMEQNDINLSEENAKHCWRANPNDVQDLPRVKNQLREIDEKTVSGKAKPEQKKLALKRLMKLIERGNSSYRDFELMLFELLLKEAFAPKGAFDSTFISDANDNGSRWEALKEASELTKEARHAYGLVSIGLLKAYDKNRASISTASVLSKQFIGQEATIGQSLEWWDAQAFNTSVEKRAWLEAKNCSNAMDEEGGLELLCQILEAEDAAKWVTLNALDRFLNEFDRANGTHQLLAEAMPATWFREPRNGPLQYSAPYDYQTGRGNIAQLVKDLQAIDALHTLKGADKINDWDEIFWIINTYDELNPPTSEERPRIQAAIRALRNYRQTNLIWFLDRLEQSLDRIPKSADDIMKTLGSEYAGNLARALDHLCNTTEANDKKLTWPTIWAGFEAWSSPGLARWEASYLSDLVDAAKNSIKSAGRDPNDQLERIQKWLAAFGPVEPDQPFLRMVNAYAEYGPVTVAFWVSVQGMSDLTEAEKEEFCEPLRKFTLNDFSTETSGGFAFFSNLANLLDDSTTSAYQKSVIQRAAYDLDKMRKGAKGPIAAGSALPRLISTLNPGANINGSLVAALEKQALNAIASYAQPKIRKDLVALLEPLGPESKA